MDSRSVLAGMVASRPRTILVIALACMLALATPTMLFAGTYESTWRASPTYNGGEAETEVAYPVISNDGRYVVFSTEAENVVADDDNEVEDVFIYDRTTNSVSRIVAKNGNQGEEYAEYPDISADGRYVAFNSPSRYETDGSSSSSSDVYVLERLTGSMTLASRATAGDADGNSYNPSLSRDGRYVAFLSGAENLVSGDTNGYNDIFVRDLVSNTTKRASVKSNGAQVTDNWSTNPFLSASGRYVVFESMSTQLVPGDSNGDKDIFLHDMMTGATELISVATNGTQADASSDNPTVSSDGRYVVFQSGATTLVSADTNGRTDIFLRDRQLGTTTRVDINAAGAQLPSGGWDPRISDDGRYVVFLTNNPNVAAGVDNGSTSTAYVRDLVTGTNYLASKSYDGEPNEDTVPGDHDIGVTGNSVYVVFPSDATNLVPDEQSGDDYQIYVHEMTNLPGPVGPNEVAGTTRFSTGVAISKASFASGSDTVIIATGRNWPDALGGAALAGAWDAPILLVDTASVPSVVKTEIERLGATHAIILGGETVVTPAVKTALMAIGDIDTVGRIGGANRYTTAQMVADATIAKAGPDWNGTAFVATGANFPDALAGSPLAYANKWPIYLVKPNSVVPTNVMKADGVKDVLILGGDAVVSEFVEEAFEANFGSAHVDRLAGANRYGTAVVVGTYGVEEAGMHWDGMAFATGENFPDALAGGSITGRHDSVMLLVETDALPGYVKNAVTSHKDRITTYSYLGGTAAIQTPVRTQIDTILK